MSDSKISETKGTVLDRDEMLEAIEARLTDAPVYVNGCVYEGTIGSDDPIWSMDVADRELYLVEDAEGDEMREIYDEVMLGSDAETPSPIQEFVDRVRATQGDLVLSGDPAQGEYEYAVLQENDDSIYLIFSDVVMGNMWSYELEVCLDQHDRPLWAYQRGENEGRVSVSHVISRCG